MHVSFSFFVQNNDNYTKNDQHDKKWIENNLLIYFNNWQFKNFV